MPEDVRTFLIPSHRVGLRRRRGNEAGAVGGGAVAGGAALPSGATSDQHLCGWNAMERSGAHEREADSVPSAAASGNPCDLRREIKVIGKL